MKIELTHDEYEGLLEIADLAITDQENYIRDATPALDYGDEWPDVAAERARKFHAVASLLRKLDIVQMAKDADELADAFTAMTEPQNKS